MDWMQTGIIYELSSIITDKSHKTQIFSIPKINFNKAV